VVSPTRVTSQGWRLRKLMLLYLNNRRRSKARTCCETVALERLSDISADCSHCCFMIPDHVSCMFKAVEV
jgi:hypothetical protein